MSSRILLCGSILTFIIGGTAAFAGLRGLSEPVAEARLVVTVSANPTPETFGDIVSGAESIAATLAELASFDTFRMEVLGGGFVISPDLFTGSPDAKKEEWRRRVRVERLDDTLVLRVQARGRTPDEARALAGAVLHALALHAPAVVGNHVVQVAVEGLPTLVFSAMELRVGYALLGGGVAGVTLGFAALGFAISWLWKPSRLRHVREGNRAPRSWSLATGEEKTGISAPALPTSQETSAPVSTDDARYWLQKFLEEHQRMPRKSADTIATWEDFPESSRGTPWLKPPDPLSG